MGLLTACGGASQTSNDTETTEVVVSGDTLTVNAASPILQRLVVAPVEMEDHAMTLHTSGVVTAVPTAYAEVAAPFAGRVQRSLVQIGQQVRAGAPLFELSSSDYSEIVKSYRQAQSELAAAKKQMERVRDLNSNKVASNRELEEAQLDYQNKLEEFRHAESVAKEYQIDVTHAEVGQPMTVRTPISGRVLRNDLVRGEYIKEDADSKLVVADLSKVWVKANITESEAVLTDRVEHVEIRLVARPDSVISGRLVFRGGMLDEETRTMQTIIECDNPRGLMMPNMYAKVLLTTPSSRCVTVPKSAVLQGEDACYVLRKVGDNRFVRTTVKVQSAENGRLIVTEGLTPEDEIITEGAMYLIDYR